MVEIISVTIVAQIDQLAIARFPNLQLRQSPSTTFCLPFIFYTQSREQKKKKKEQKNKERKRITRWCIKRKKQKGEKIEDGRTKSWRRHRGGRIYGGRCRALHTRRSTWNVLFEEVKEKRKRKRGREERRYRARGNHPRWLAVCRRIAGVTGFAADRKTKCDRDATFVAMYLDICIYIPFRHSNGQRRELAHDPLSFLFRDGGKPDQANEFYNGRLLHWHWDYTRAGRNDQFVIFVGS